MPLPERKTPRLLNLLKVTHDVNPTQHSLSTSLEIQCETKPCFGHPVEIFGGPDSLSSFIALSSHFVFFNSREHFPRINTAT